MGPPTLPAGARSGHTGGMKKHRVLMGVMALALAFGVMSRKAAVSGGDASAPIVEDDEQLRDAVASLPPAIPPSVAMPSRVAVWASPALRRKEAEHVLVSRRRERASSMMRVREASLEAAPGIVR